MIMIIMIRYHIDDDNDYYFIINIVQKEIKKTLSQELLQAWALTGMGNGGP